MTSTGQENQIISTEFTQVTSGISITKRTKITTSRLQNSFKDLVDKIKAPVYAIEKDGTSAETCVIRFHAGPPYQDIAFRIVNKEWEYSHKKGYRCTFERGILNLHFNFKRHRYRR
ncbi:hypothetical protein Bca52824_090457 [Brassica carinata]|uniref:Splicing factor Cactin C-terminal domain-containing protein n=1 Tax=Brassica carinata TaxID=52824 RepID=A0A8X7NXE6_BRACI|nr:hypothetical protein Bca52824_090457 [Brassica carinata]